MYSIPRHDLVRIPEAAHVTRVHGTMASSADTSNGFGDSLSGGCDECPCCVSFATLARFAARVRVMRMQLNEEVLRRLEALDKHLASTSALAATTATQQAELAMKQTELAASVNRRIDGMGARVTALHGALSELGDEVASAEVKVQVGSGPEH